MNEIEQLNVGKVSPPLSQKRYSAKNIRNIRIGYFALVLIYVFFVLIPLSYTWRATIPPPDQLQVTSGELAYKDVGKRGNRLTGIETASGTIFFTCAKGKFGAYPDCIFPKTEYEKLAGQPATVWWFEQPIYLFSTQNRLVRLVVAREEKMSYVKAVHLTEEAAKSAPWFIGVLLVLFVSIVVGFERMIRRQQREQQRNG